MNRPFDDHPAPSRRLAAIAVVALIALLPAMAAARTATAADLPPPLMTKFTRSVQPLLLNKCAAGACHGGPAAHPPRLHRGDGAGHVDRQVTLANIEALTTLVPPGQDAAAVIAAISGRHPANAARTMPTAVPLSTQERAVLETWLTSALAHDAARPAARVASRSAAADAASRPAVLPPLHANRFRAMLDAAANPPPLPPPQEPQGLILGTDGEPDRR